MSTRKRLKPFYVWVCVSTKTGGVDDEIWLTRQQASANRKPWQRLAYLRISELSKRPKK